MSMGRERPNGLAIIKDARGVGSDGLMLRALLASGNGWRIFALDRRGVPVSAPGVQLVSVQTSSLPSRLKMYWLLWRAIRREGIREVDDVLVGSAELAALLTIFGLAGRRRYYLMSDITGHHKRRLIGGFVKALEWSCLRLGWIPVVTSPGFWRSHLESLAPRERASCYLVHNITLPPLSTKKEYSGRPMIGWFGYLRCRTSAKLLIDAVHERVAGLTVGGVKDDLGELAGAFAGAGFVDKGAYQESSLSTLYEQIDFAWCCDWELGVNSRLLLPNRLYQAILTGTPIIASAGSIVAEIVSGFDLGLVIGPGCSELSGALEGVSSEDWLKWAANCRGLARSLPQDGGWNYILSGQGVSIVGMNSVGAFLSNCG